MGKIDNWLTELACINEEIKDLQQDRKDLQQKILASLEANDTHTIDWEHKGERSKATAVYSSTLNFDEEEIAKALTKSMWEQVSSRRLDQKKLEDKVARGSVDPAVISEHTTEVPRAPYIRISFPKSAAK